MGKSLDAITSIRKLVLHKIQQRVRNEEDLLQYLKRWWCFHYNRPYKDPLLDEYTFEELLVEYYEVLYLKDDKERQQAQFDIYRLENDEDDEEWLREQMGDDYMSSDEMKELLKGKDGNSQE